MIRLLTLITILLHTLASPLAVGVSQSAFAGSEWAAGMDKEEQQQAAGMIGAVVGYLTSGSEAANVSGGQQIAISGIANNRQLHETEIEWIKRNSEIFAQWMCDENAVCNLSEAQAAGILSAETLSGVSDSFTMSGGDPAHPAYHEYARMYISANY